ncbi:MAG: hypothetical protein ABR562_03860 [Thermoplasmatota archaeon]|nr:hypothetical protein [Halobacteriales archaeon]
MSKPAWTLRCRVCKTQFGPLTEAGHVSRLLSGASQMDCGHSEAEVVSQSL